MSLLNQNRPVLHWFTAEDLKNSFSPFLFTLKKRQKIVKQKTSNAQLIVGSLLDSLPVSRPHLCDTQINQITILLA